MFDLNTLLLEDIIFLMCAHPIVLLIIAVTVFAAFTVGGDD